MDLMDLATNQYPTIPQSAFKFPVRLRSTKKFRSHLQNIVCHWVIWKMSVNTEFVCNET